MKELELKKREKGNEESWTKAERKEEVSLSLCPDSSLFLFLLLSTVGKRQNHKTISSQPWKVALEIEIMKNSLLDIIGSHLSPEQRKNGSGPWLPMS